MNKQTLEDLIAFCQQRNLSELAAGLRAEVTPGPNSKEMQDRALQIIKKAVR